MTTDTHQTPADTTPAPTPAVTVIPLTIAGAFGHLPELTDEANRAARAGETATPHTVLLIHTRGGRVHVPGHTGIHQVSKWEQALRRLERLPIPIIAHTQGTLNGPGLEALLIADYRITTPDLHLDLTQADGTIWPGMAIHRLAQQIGIARTRRLVLFNHPLNATEAHNIGLVDHITAPHQTQQAIDHAINQTTTNKTAPDLATRRRLLLDAHTTQHEEALGPHLAACNRTLEHTTTSQPPTGTS